MNWQRIGNIAGKNGRDGRDGQAVGITGAVVNRDGHLILAFSDSSTKDVGIVVGRDGHDGKPIEMDAIRSQIKQVLDQLPAPKDGKDGKDGLGFDDADLVLDDERGWILRLAQGERVKEWDIPLPFFKGNWEAGITYPKGAGVRWDGHYWQATERTYAQPGEGSTQWRIVVSRGKQGRTGEPGKEGRPGRDLTQIDPGTGRKW